MRGLPAAGVLLLSSALLLPSPAAGVPGADTPGVHAPSESSRSVVPTSVLVVADETGASAALHALDRVYAELSALVRPDRDAIPSMRPPLGRRVGPTVTVSWLLRDTTVWRTDVIYYDAPGGPWIETELRIAGVDADSRTEWHTSSDSDRLVGVLEDLAVVGPDAGAAASSGATDVTTAAATAAAGDSVAPDSPWRWVLGGMAAGALSALAVAWFAGWWRGRDREPRQQLVDL